MNNKIPIVCIHGIRRQDKWYETLKERLDPTKYEIIVFQDTYWTILTLIIPFFRTRKIETFQKFYDNIRQKYESLPYLVCHSFGSYIFFKSIKKYDVVKFDKVIMVGSILNPKMNWDTFFNGSSPQIKKMLHEYGLKDRFVWMTRFIEDGGNSGEIGFVDIRRRSKVEKSLTQKQYQEYDHSDYFRPLHIEEHWIPFLTGNELPYNPKILREEIMPRLYKNIAMLNSNKDIFEINKIIYRARIDKNGNYYLKYNFQGNIIGVNAEYFSFKSSADSVKDFDRKKVLALNETKEPLEVSLEQTHFTTSIKIDCDTDKEKYSNYELSIQFCWDGVMNFDQGDTDHFALQGIANGFISLNFPYNLKNPLFFLVRDEQVIERKTAFKKEELDGSFSYYISIENDSESIDGIIFYYEGRFRKNKNRNKLSLNLSSRLKIERKDENGGNNNMNIIFRPCSKSDIKNIYFLESRKIEFENSAQEQDLLNRLDLFPYGFWVAYHGDLLVGYIESIIISDWQFGTFEEIKNFENHYDIDGDTLYIIFIAVDPDYRENKIASKFLEIMENEVASRFNNIDKIKLVSKDEAIKLYKNNGYEVEKNLENFLPNTPINAIMTKRIIK